MSFSFLSLVQQVRCPEARSRRGLPACPAARPAQPLWPPALVRVQPPSTPWLLLRDPCFQGKFWQRRASESSHTCEPCSPRQLHCEEWERKGELLQCRLYGLGTEQGRRKGRGECDRANHQCIAHLLDVTKLLQLLCGD